MSNILYYSFVQDVEIKTIYDHLWAIFLSKSYLQIYQLPNESRISSTDMTR